jgi:exodeoxyribonuclease V alpha subunit
LFEEKRRFTLGIVKRKMFGKKPARWPKLQKLVDENHLLAIDLAYAETQVPNAAEEEAAEHAYLLAMARKGHLCILKEKLEPPFSVERDCALPKYVYIEEQIATHVKRLLALPKSEQIVAPSDLTQEQTYAVQNALRHPLSLITGGPGTGKTHTAGRIAETFDKTVIVSAPTGKAASHLENQIKRPVKASTLHSLLKVRSPLDYTKEVDPLDASLVIVDESSMIAPFLFARLLAAIGPNTHLVLMGDAHQLPAVEGGSIFSDLIASKQIPTTTLTKCMRSDRSEILGLAEAILQAEEPQLRNLDLAFDSGDLEEIYNRIWSHVQKKNFDTFRILSTLRKGPLGVDALNQFLFEKFSQKSDHFPIMITRNDARTGLCNGDMGMLTSEKKAHFSNNRSFSTHELPPYEYAYCISVHKSQGSEYDHVLFLVPEGSENFGREVLYTAVTRARRTLEIEGSEAVIQSALKKTTQRYSTLVKKLKT